MIRRLGILMFGVLWAMLATAEVSDEIEEKERELRDVRRKLAESRVKARELETKEASILQKLQALDVQLELNQELIDELKAKEKRKGVEIDEVGSEIEDAEKELKHRQEILSRRLRATYKHGSIHPLELILTSKSFTDMVTRTKYLTLIAQQDVRLEEQILKNKEELTDLSGRLSEDLSEMKSTRTEKEDELANLDTDKEKRKGFLEETRKEKKNQQELARELEKAEAELQLLIDDLMRRRTTEVVEEGEPPVTRDWDFAKYQGKLRWPVQGKVVSGFGSQKHPKYGTSTLNNGIDIEAPSGTGVHVIADGQVVYADRFLGYGQVIIVDHGAGYYTLYAHLSAILTDVGHVVGEGNVIGEVGDSGSLEGPRLHFEIRDQGRPSDPAAWLR